MSYIIQTSVIGMLLPITGPDIYAPSPFQAFLFQIFNACSVYFLIFIFLWWLTTIASFKNRLHTKSFESSITSTLFCSKSSSRFLIIVLLLLQVVKAQQNCCSYTYIENPIVSLSCILRFPKAYFSFLGYVDSSLTSVQPSRFLFCTDYFQKLYYCTMW